MFYPRALNTCKQGQYSVLRERHMRYCENCGQIGSESRELLDEQREKIRVLFFCGDRGADHNVAWLRLKHRIQLLGEQL
jgi:hypothetical protein